MADQIVEPAGSHEPTEFAKTPKKAAASGWIGSALEYYDFFIYAQAAALVFPIIFFKQDNPKMNIVIALATFGVGYVARPIGAFVLGHWGDKHGRKNVLVLCMMLMGLSTFCVALLPTYAAIGIFAPILLVALRLIQGFAVGGELAGAGSMTLEHAPFGRRGYFTSFTLQGVQAGQILAAAVFLPLSWLLSEDAFQSWGWRIPFLLSAVVVFAGYIIRRRVDETPAFQEEEVHGEVPQAPIVQAVKENGADMLRVICMALMNVVPTTVTVFGATFATNAAYGVGLHTSDYLWITVAGNVVAVILIPFVGDLSDRIGRRPVIIFGCLAAGLLGYPYLWAVSHGNLPIAFLLAILMWGIVYQGYNAVFPAFFPEQFPTKTRVSAFAVAQNIGTLITAFLPAIYPLLAPPTPGACVVSKKFVPDTVLPSGETCRAAADAGEGRVILVVGTVTIVFAVIAAIAAYFSRETSRIHMNDLGKKDAVPVPEEEYQRMRIEAKALVSK
jgi:MFS family permease